MSAAMSALSLNLTLSPHQEFPGISFEAITAHEAESSDAPAPVPFTSPSDSEQPSFEELHKAITETDDLITTLGGTTNMVTKLKL